MKKKNIDVARAWRDEDYYMSLTEEERASLGDHPAGAHGGRAFGLPAYASRSAETRPEPSQL